MDVDLPGWATAIVHRVIGEMADDPRWLGLMAGGSATTGGMDEFSDLDLVLVCRPEAHAELLREAPARAARLGPLLSCFTGEHVGEPRLLIALYGPPPVHVDLKLVAEPDLDHRVEDGLILWQRDDALDRAFRRAAAQWPLPDRQWIEDRFWIWVHYAATKIGRGELFECLSALGFLRDTVFGPLLAVAHGQRPQGVRRVERWAPEFAPALRATLGEHSRAGCVAATHAAIDLYRRLRDGAGPGPIRRTEAEKASIAYLEAIGAAHEPR
jgi:hypothetical protein